MDDFSASAGYSACEDTECLEKLKAEPHGSGHQELMRFRFSVIACTTMAAPPGP